MMNVAQQKRDNVKQFMTITGKKERKKYKHYNDECSIKQANAKQFVTIEKEKKKKKKRTETKIGSHMSLRMG